MKQTIGVIVPELKHPFFAAILDGIEDIAFQQGYSIKVGQSKENAIREAEEIEALISGGIDGLLISVSQQTKKTDHFKKVIEASIPLVFFDRFCNNLNASRVIVDDFDAAFKATEYLILSGYKQIAHIAGPQFILTMKNRYEGYLAALNKYEMPFNKDLVMFGELNEDSGADRMKSLLKLKERPDAVFAVNDPVAVGALFQIKKAGLQIVNDVAMVGFSDNPIAALLDPPLTTVAQPCYEIGQSATKLLIEHIHGRQDIVEKILKTKLIIRQSS